MLTAKVSIDGEIVDGADARVSVFDRGFLYGDSVFEVYRTYGGVPFAEREHLDPGLPVLKAVGYPELAGHLAGRSTLEAAIAAAQQQTRRYAKRQMTWFRHQLPDRDPGAWPNVDVLKYSFVNDTEIFSKIS